MRLFRNLKDGRLYTGFVQRLRCGCEDTYFTDYFTKHVRKTTYSGFYQVNDFEPIAETQTATFYHTTPRIPGLQLYKNNKDGRLYIKEDDHYVDYFTREVPKMTKTGKYNERNFYKV